MKTTGIVLLVFGALGSLGQMIAGGTDHLGAGFFWIGIGAYLIHRAEQKKKEKERMKQWEEESNS